MPCAPASQTWIQCRLSRRVAACVMMLAMAAAGRHLSGATAAANPPAADPAADTLSFCRPPYVHPRLLGDLLGWLSDEGDQVVAINLLDANDSNRYYGEIQTGGVGRVAPHHPLVYSRVEQNQSGQKYTEELGYEYVGLTSSGVHVLHIWSSGMGTMVEHDLLLVTLAYDFGLTAMPDLKSGALRFDRRRLLIRKLAEYALGDHWDGELRVDGNKIRVGRDQGLYSGDPRTEPYNSKDLILELKDPETRPAILRPCP
jgi:hypothetical protein